MQVVVVVVIIVVVVVVVQKSRTKQVYETSRDRYEGGFGSQSAGSVSQR